MRGTPYLRVARSLRERSCLCCGGRGPPHPHPGGACARSCRRREGYLAGPLGPPPTPHFSFMWGLFRSGREDTSQGPHAPARTGGRLSLLPTPPRARSERGCGLARFRSPRTGWAPERARVVSAPGVRRVPETRCVPVPREFREGSAADSSGAAHKGGPVRARPGVEGVSGPGSWPRASRRRRAGPPWRRPCGGSPATRSSRCADPPAAWC